MPSMVVMRRPVTDASGVMQLRVGLPSTCTVQAPHSAMPQPNFVPVSSRKSRSTHRSGVSGSASTVIGLPLTFRGVMSELYSSGLGETDRRIFAAVLWPGDERLRVVLPELADVAVSRHRYVDELAVSALDLADVDVEDRLAVLVQPQRPHRAVVELHVVQRVDERRLVLELALHELHRFLDP